MDAIEHYLHDAETAEGEAASVLDLLTRPSWQRRAACRAFPELSWFPERGQDVTVIKAICRACDVREQCLDFALEVNDLHGFWGGVSGRERQRLRRQDRRAA